MMVLKVDRASTPPVLQRMHICLFGQHNRCKAGCRQFICLDSCFLKGIYNAQLLTVIGFGGKNNTYPIAYAFVEIEKFK